MQEVRLLVCGGRDFGTSVAEAQYLNYTLHAISAKVKLVCLIHGAARGADRLAGSWAKANNVLEIAVPADWNTHKKAAGPIRNQKMLDDYLPTHCVAFPGGSGTADMIKRCRSAGVKVLEVKPLVTS